ncbi:alpha-N-acetylglucosaminidase [Pedobacter foliorum]|uniref:alpha-N-acetylglucosaminidase n=1 Tax=Pedobacter foliorum TaxID=2739058 RepID=UPI001C253327|nr:alpha-N-acetylglucosaminidase [Pedobacter foliorum]
MIKKITCIIAVLMWCCSLSTRAISALHKKTLKPIEATRALIKRVLPNHYNQIHISFIQTDKRNDVFELESIQGKIILRGNNPVSIGSALNWYMKYYCHVQQSWCGDNMDLPIKLPLIQKKVRVSSPYRDRAYLNYCTFNYSMVWWDWKRWEKEIDWMALHGVNMPLAITGQEAVWQQTLRQYGMNDDEIRSFLVGPAYQAWQWMTNIEGIYGPLPQKWIERSIVLGKKILQRERELGMKPILQGFTGYVPIKLIEKQPTAKILKKPVWFFVGEETAQLDPLDPLFARMSKTFLEEQTKLFGTDHIYAADPFHEGEPPVKGDDYLSSVGQAIYKATASVDPKAVIAMQTWSMRKPIVEAIPQDKILMLDLNTQRWKGSDAFWGRPWVAGIIHNFGGNTAMGGDLDAVLARYPALLNKPEQSKSFKGIGMFPEAIEHNPVIYEAVSEMAWHREKPNTKVWLYDYLKSRYGKLDQATIVVWDTLLNTVYGKHGVETFMESAICARPALKINGASPNGALNSEKNYRFASLWQASAMLLKASPDIQQKETYKYDLVDLMRQCLADLAIPLQKRMARAYEISNVNDFNQSSALFLNLMQDFDKLLGTRKEFLLGKWIADARAIGSNNEEKNLYEKNARGLVTIWGPYDPNAIQYDYSARQWNGLVSGFYQPRWEMFIDFLGKEIKKDSASRYKEVNINHRFNRPANEVNEFYKMISKWEADWANTPGELSAVKPFGSELIIVKSLYQKWQPIAEGFYGEK